MKLEAQFEIKKGKLFSKKTGELVDTTSLIRVDTSTVDAAVLSSESFAGKVTGGDSGLIGVCISWKMVEISDGIYNEEFLASLRDFLKNTEAQGVSAVIVPVTDGKAGGPALEQYTAAMCHTARRIKDCASVIGFAVPEEFAGNGTAVSSFIDAMAVKHSHYVYFAEQDGINNCLISYQMR
jgi:hypothetical protein